MEEPKKFKLNRKLLILALPAVLIPTILALIVMKGPDLGQAEEDAKAAEKLQAERESLMNARVQDPEEAAKEEARRAAIAAQEAARNSLPPPPDETVAKSDLTRKRELVDSREIVSQTLNDPERQSVLGSGGASSSSDKPKSFVVYTAPAKEGIVSGTADAVADAATIKTSEEKKTEKPFLSQNNEKVVAESTTVAKRIDGLHWIAPGTIIRAVLLNAVDTSLPGQVTARVTEPVYDSRYGRYLVVPAGTKLIGQYDSAIANGQKRVMMSFSSMITPSGGVIDLNGVRSSDALGRVGIPGELHTYFWKRMGVAALLALESVALDRLANSQTTISTTDGTSTTTNTSEAAKIISEAAKQEPWMKPIAPKITIEEGQKISVVTVAHIEVPPIANKR